MCNVAITSVVGAEDDNGQVTVLRVTGTATDCDQVCATLRHGSSTSDVRQATVTGGTWTVDFTEAGKDFKRGDLTCGPDNDITVEVHCCAEPDCKDSIKVQDLLCGCPTIGDLSVSVGNTCENGQRTVTVSVDVTPGAGDLAIVEIQSGGVGVVAPINVTAPDTTVSADFQLPPGQHEIELAVVFPLNCTGPDPVTIDVPDCAPAFTCPGVEIHAEAAAVCEHGSRVVTVTATLDTGSSETIAARLVRIDASGHELEQLDQGTGPGHLELSGSSSVPGAETARYRVVITEPAGCGPQTQDFDVPTCDTCPHVDFGRPGLSDTCDDQGRRDVVMSVQLQGSPGQALDARLVHDHLGQASVRDHQTGAGTITLTDDEELDPGEHTFRVEFTRPRGCPPQETHVAVPPCGGEPPNGGLRPQPIPCWVLELLGFIFFFAGIGMLIGGAAADLLPVALAGDALIIVGNVLLSIWAWACASCEALRRLGIAFGAAFLVLTIVGSILIGIGALNVGLGFLFAGLAFGGLALLFLFVFASKCGR